MSSSLCIKKRRSFFILSAQMERIVSPMKNFDKYRPGYYMPPEPCMDWAKKERLTQAPDWCSVDLRDGNQALITPMNLEEKLDFYKFLLEVGFDDQKGKHPILQYEP